MKAVIGKEKIKKIAIINGSGSSFFNLAYNKGADCIITGDTTYHYASDYKEMGVSIIDIGHFDSEWIVFQEVMKEIQENFSEVEVLVSKKSKDPYTFL